MTDDKIPVRVYFTISLLGFWLIASTLTFGMEHPGLIGTNLLSGALLVFLGLISRKHPTALQIWAITGLGIWLQLSPLIFWASKSGCYVNDTFIGCWIIALAITLHPMPGHTLREIPTIPPGWSYNPSAWPQRLPIAFIAFICWMLARYLAAYQLGYIDTVWEPFFHPGTKSVLESTVSKAFPVSDAGLGAFAYTLEFFSACQGGTNRWRTAPWLVLVFGILVIPVSIISTILIILQPLAVGTWCTVCLLTAIAMLISIPFAVGEVAATLQYLRRYKEKPFLTLLFRGGECPNEKPDFISPRMDQPIGTLLKASLSGMTFPWNLVFSALLGIAIMATPSLFGLQGVLYNVDPILGAFTTVISVISFAEISRNLRWVNCLFALFLLLATWWFSHEQSFNTLLLHTGFSLLIALLSFRKGPLRERFSFQAL